MPSPLRGQATGSCVSALLQASNFRSDDSINGGATFYDDARIHESGSGSFSYLSTEELLKSTVPVYLGGQLDSTRLHQACLNGRGLLIFDTLGVDCQNCGTPPSAACRMIIVEKSELI
jgi:hypothetical protein